MEVGCVTYFVEKGDTTTREHNSTLNEEEALKVVLLTLIYTTVECTWRKESSPFSIALRAIFDYSLRRSLYISFY